MHMQHPTALTEHCGPILQVTLQLSNRDAELQELRFKLKTAETAIVDARAEARHIRMSLVLVVPAASYLYPCR